MFGKDSILHLGHVETADSRDAWANAADPEARRRCAAARVWPAVHTCTAWLPIKPWAAPA